MTLVDRLRTYRHLRASQGRSRPAVTMRPARVDAIRHDLLQHVATGLLLSDTTDDAPVDEATRSRLLLLHQQWEDAAQLVALLDPTAAGDGTGSAPVDLIALTRRCVAGWRVTRHVELFIDDPACVVLGDEVLIRRAIANLVDNACRASPIDGTVRVRVGAGVGGDRGGDESFVEVADDGPGFGHIPSGSRLGLRIARAAVATAGGHLTIQTGIDVETVVRMSFPAADEATL